MSKKRIKRLLEEIKIQTGIKPYFLIKIEKGRDRYAAIIKYFTIGNYCFAKLSVGKSSLKFSDDALKAVLMHEIAHCFVKGETKIEEERACDMFVLEQGLGKELLQFHKEHEKKYRKYKKEDGLTKSEIRKLFKKKTTNEVNRMWQFSIQKSIKNN